MNQANATLPLAVAPNATTFAEEQGVGSHLLTMLEATQRLFPNARRLAVRLDADPEIADDRHLVFEVDVPPDVDQALAAQRRWNDALFACCPAPLVTLFALSVELTQG